jgi:hypothetical protein
MGATGSIEYTVGEPMRGTSGLSAARSVRGAGLVLGDILRAPVGRERHRMTARERPA